MHDMVDPSAKSRAARILFLINAINIEHASRAPVAYKWPRTVVTFW